MGGWSTKVENGRDPVPLISSLLLCQAIIGPLPARAADDRQWERGQLWLASRQVETRRQRESDPWAAFAEPARLQDLCAARQKLSQSAKGPDLRHGILLLLIHLLTFISTLLTRRLQPAPHTELSSNTIGQHGY